MLGNALMILTLVVSGGVPWRTTSVIALLTIYGRPMKQAVWWGLLAGVVEDSLQGSRLGSTALGYLCLQLVLHLIKERLTLSGWKYLSLVILIAGSVDGLLASGRVAISGLIGQLGLALVLYPWVKEKTRPGVYLRRQDGS